MKKVLVFVLIAVFALSGCSTVSQSEDNSQNETVKKPVEHKGNIKVSFARNSFLDIDYYYDKDCTQLVDMDNCYLNIGESIYAADIEVKNSKSNLYKFSKFRINEYDSTGKKGKTLASTSSELIYKTRVIYTIPKNFEGAGISIVPMGEYSERDLEFDSFFFDTKGVKKAIPGKVWKINEESDSFANGTKTINPVESYSVSFDYSDEDIKNSYYFVKSTPECFYHKNSDSTVVFKTLSPNETTEKFSVEMHPFIQVSINNPDWKWVISDLFAKNVIINVQKNGKEVEGLKKGSDNLKKKDITIDKLMISDSVSITVGKNYKLSCSKLNMSEAIEVEGGYKYTIKFPDNNEKNYQLTLGKRNSDAEGKFDKRETPNGVVTVSDEKGNEIKDGEELPADDSKVTVRIEGNEGYYVSGSDTKDGVYEKTMTYSDYQKKIDDIVDEHIIKKLISFKLPDSDENGSCEYKIDGEKVSEKISDVREDQKLELTYTLDDDSGYEIERENFFDKIWSGITSSKSITVQIPLNTDLDGSSLIISDYINLKEKE